MTLPLVLPGNAQALSPEAVMKRPLILGASVSAGHLTESPGRILAKRYTEEKHIRTIAFGGTSGADVLKKVSEATLADRSVVIGIDLFFWDSIRQSPDESLAAMHRLFAEVRRRDIPLVIGDIPDLLPSRQKQAAKLNQEIRRRCTRQQHCYILPLDELARSLIRNGGLSFQGQTYSILQLVPDGLHISRIGSTYLSERIAQLLFE